MIPLEKSMEEEKIMMLSSALAELVVGSKVKKFQLTKGLKRKMKMELRYRRICKCQVMVKGLIRKWLK